MVRDPHDGTLGDALGGLIGRAAIGAAIGAVLLLTLGLVAELLRRRDRAHRVLALLDLTLPMGVRTAVVSLMALLATFTGSHPAGADDGVRAWLHQSTATTAVASSTAARTTATSVTTSPAAPPVATPEALAEHATPSTTLPPTPGRRGPVVLIPPLVIEAPVAPTPATAAPAAAPAPVAPVAPSAALPLYVVQRDDCLWSIAAHLLGVRADARSIDLGWRQIYAANRAAIGDDPNLIHIGLTLELPPLVAQP